MILSHRDRKRYIKSSGIIPSQERFVKKRIQPVSKIAEKSYCKAHFKVQSLKHINHIGTVATVVGHTKYHQEAPNSITNIIGICAIIYTMIHRTTLKPFVTLLQHCHYPLVHVF